MVFDVLSNHLVKVFPHYKSFVSDSAHNARDKNHIIFSFLSILWVKNDLDYLLWNAKEFNAVIDETFLEERCELLYFIDFPGGTFLKFFKKILSERNFVVYF